MTRASGAPFLVMLLVATVPTTRAQERILPCEDLGPFSGAPVIGEPLSADATTTVTNTIGGRPQVRSVTAHYYRDSLGRVRVEQAFAKRAGDGTKQGTLALIDLLSDRVVYAVDTTTRTVRWFPRSVAAQIIAGGATFAFPLSGATVHLEQHLPTFAGVSEPAGGCTVGADFEFLGMRTLQGIDVVGWRATTNAPTTTGSSIRLSVERWDSPGLRLTVRSRVVDGTGNSIEHRLLNVARSEPPVELFAVPLDFAVRGMSIGDPAVELVPMPAPWSSLR